MPTKLLIVSKSNNYKGSLRLNPKVILGLLSILACQATASSTILVIYLWNTRYSTRLHTYDYRVFQYPCRDCYRSGSYFKQVILYNMISLDSRQTTFDITKFRIDFATKYYSSFEGYTFLLTKNPRTRACIFLNLGRVSFIISFRVAVSFYFYFYLAVFPPSYAFLGCTFDAFTIDRFQPNDFYAAKASKERLFLSFELINFYEFIIITRCLIALYNYSCILNQFWLF